MESNNTDAAVLALMDLSFSRQQAQLDQSTTTTTSTTTNSSCDVTSEESTTTDIALMDEDSISYSSGSSYDEADDDDDDEEYTMKRTKRRGSQSKGIQKKKKNKSKVNRKRKREITKEEIKKYFNFSQAKAAKMLGISVSTLKRRYYSMGMGKWPYPENKFLAKKRSINYITLPQNRPEKLLDAQTLQQLFKAFKSTAPDSASY